MMNTDLVVVAGITTDVVEDCLVADGAVRADCYGLVLGASRCQQVRVLNDGSDARHDDVQTGRRRTTTRTTLVEGH